MDDDERVRAVTHPAVPSARMRTPDRPRAHVLVVEDEAVLRSTIVQLLRPRFDVSTAEHGGIALSMAEADQTGAYSVIISDVRMPWVNGVDLHRALASRGHPLARRFVWMTGGGLSEGLSRYVETSGLPLLEKPFATADLESVLARFGDPAHASAAG